MSDLSSPTRHRPQALPLLGAALLFLVGATLTWSSVSSGSDPGVALLGALMLGLAVCSALVQLLRVGVAPGAQAVVSTGSSPGRPPMVSVLARTTSLLVACLAISWVALCAAAGGVVALSAQRPTLGVLLVVVAVLAFGYLIVPVSRGLRSGRVELTPEWLAAERNGSRWQVPWTEVSGSVPPRTAGEPLAVVVHTTATHTLSSGWPGWVKLPTAPQGVLAVPVDELPVLPEVLARVIALCADDPGLRAQLGTPASGDWSSWPPGPPAGATEAL